MQWHREITRLQWRTLIAAQLGWMLDAMDVMLYSFALTTIRAEFHLSSAAAGALGAAPLVTSALGGMLFGWLSDRYGRARALMWSILAFSAFTAFTATSRTVGELVFWRAIVGIGLGGEWAAGSVLVAETWPAQHRGKAIGLMQSAWAVGYLLAALLAALVLPLWGWRPLFLAGLANGVLTSVYQGPQLQSANVFIFRHTGIARVFPQRIGRDHLPFRHAHFDLFFENALLNVCAQGRVIFEVKLPGF